MAEIRVEITSSAFRGPNGLANLDDCRRQAEESGFEFGVQLHNSAQPDEIETLRRTGVALSAHAPLNALYNWNLAAESVDDVMESIAGNVRFFRELGITASVFHGFVMTDLPVPAFGHGRSYSECMQEVFRPELAHDPRLPFNGNYFGMPEFTMRRERVRERLALLRRRWPDIVFCLENDFPAYGSSNLFAETASCFENPLCLDTGHLWMSCRLYGREFHREAPPLLQARMQPEPWRIPCCPCGQP